MQLLIIFTTLFVDKGLFVGHIIALKMPFGSKGVFGELGSNSLSKGGNFFPEHLQHGFISGLDANKVAPQQN